MAYEDNNLSADDVRFCGRISAAKTNHGLRAGTGAGMTRRSIVAALAIGAALSPTMGVCSFPPDIKVTFEGWSADSKKCALRKTVVDTGDGSVVEDALYVVDLSSSRIEVDKKEKYAPQALESLLLTKVDPVRSSDAGAKTFIIGGNQYIYVDYDTVIEDVEEGTPSYTIHRRIWTLDNGMARMIFRDDESFSKVSIMAERAVEAYLSPDATKLLVLFKVSSHFERWGFVVIDLNQSRLIESAIRILD